MPQKSSTSGFFVPSRKTRDSLLTNLALIFIVLVALVPIGTTVLISFKREEDVTRNPPVIFPCDTPTSKFDLTWKYDGPDVVRISAIVNGKSEGTDVQHYERGRLVSTDLDVGDVLTAAYDADGRLASMTMSYQGKPSEVTRYTYDDKGRLAREERDRDHDGVVDQTRDYAYSCTTK